MNGVEQQEPQNLTDAEGGIPKREVRLENGKLQPRGKR
jgi:hypothetical protein